MVILVILIVMILFSMIFLRKERPKIAYNTMKDVDGDTLSRLIGETCRQMHTSESGNGINPVFLIGAIRRANHMISAKIKNNEALSEGEKWFYENYYLVYRYVYTKKDNLKSLPHIDNVPRIVAIAKIIVNNSLNTLDEEKVRKICDGIKDSVGLTYVELKEFNNALNYAILEQIYILARRLLKQEFYKKTAIGRGFNESFLKSDIYVFYLYHNGQLTDAERDKLSRKGFSEKSALMKFNNITMLNAMMAKTLFGAMRQSSAFLPTHIGLKYLKSYGIISQAVNLEEISLQTRQEYFSSLENIGRATKCGEDYVAEKLVELSKKTDKDISEILFDHVSQFKSYVKNGKIKKFSYTTNKFRQWAYVLAISLAGVSGSVVTAIYLDVIVGILSFIPFLLITENIINYLLSHTTDKKFTPQMNYQSVPYRHSVMVVVSEYISSLGQFKESVRHIEELHAGNGGENVQFAILLDTKGNDASFSTLDSEIEEYLNSSNFDKSINFFIRKRENIDGKYQGKERKRGAINALNRLLMTKDESEFTFIYRKDYLTPTYVIALDADNTLLPGEVLDMVNMMAHPYNNMYDLLACHSKYNLFSLKTRYSKRFLNESGSDVYPTYSGLYYNLFRRDIFCGKGIYRLKNFYNKLDNVFPSGKILSHDIIEGSVLTTGGGSTIFEDAPTGFLSDRERRKRWQRGDTQLLPFVGGKWMNDDGETYKTEIEPIYRFIMVKNILSAMKEICLLSIILIGLIARLPLLWFGLSLFAAPYIVNEIKILRGIAGGVLPKYILSDTAKNVLLMTEDFFMIGYYAISNFTVFISTIFRMFAGKKLLEWKTYYNTQNIKHISSYFKEFSMPYALLTVVTIVLSIFSANTLFFGIYMILSLIAYAELYVTSTQEFGRENIQAEHRKKLLNYADKTYKYFKFMLTDGYIIADNLQVKPYKGISETTSPTNIGFSMLAQICAYKLNFITLEECNHTLNRILDEVNSLPKWHGNLYNWYNVRSKQPANKFVSSVDSGNFVASVMIVEQFFKENYEAVGELKAKLTIVDTDLNALFDKNKNLFYLGYDGEKYVGHYDLLNSESRILSTVYIALYGNAEHFRCLQRDYTSFGGNTLLSWSGTMFEALMPDLFLEAPPYSVFSDTAINFAKAQSAEKFKGIWGISESGYYQFDDELRYQYYAFGLNKLALRNEKNKPIISPYSSALCLSYQSESVLNNLSVLEAIGCYNDYGFYESVDLEGTPRIISSYMSHHQGMLLCSITNYLCDNFLKKLMKNNIKISAALNLYNEMTPHVAFGIKSAEKRNKLNISTESYSKNNIKVEQYFQASALTDAQYTVLLSGLGSGFSKNFDVFINKFSGVYEENNGAFFFVEDSDKWHSPTYLPLRDDISNFEMGYNEYEIIHSNFKKSIQQKVTLLSGLNGEVRKLSVKEKGKEVAFYSSVALNSFDGFWAHPVFNGMFTEAIADGNILIIRKRSLKKGEKDFCLGIRVEGVTELVWECNDMNFIGRNRSLKNPSFLYCENNKTSQYPSVGDVLHPCAAFKGKLKSDSCQVCMMFSDDIKNLFSSLRSLPDDMYSYALLSSAHVSIGQHTHKLLGELVFLPYRQTLLNAIVDSGKRDLFGAASFWKKIIVYNFNEKDRDGFTAFLTLVRDLNTMRIKAYYAVAIKDDTPQSVRDFIERNLRLNAVKDYKIVGESDEIVKFAFIVLNSDLSFSPSKLIFSKRFQLENIERNSTDEIIEHGSTLFLSGAGGFDENDSYIADSPDGSKLPYSNVISSLYGGMLTTDNGGGFFYFENSRENKMSRFDNDPVVDSPFEFIYATTSLGTHRINGGSGKNHFTVFERGKTVHVCRCNGLVTTVKYNLLCEGRARAITIDMSNERGGITEIVYGFFPVLNWTFDPDFVTFEQKNDLIRVVNLKNNQTLFVRAFVADSTRLSMLSDREATPYFEYYTEAEHEKIIFVFTQDRGLALSLNPNNVSVEIEREEGNFKQISNIEISSEYRSFNIITRYLPYQIMSSRLMGKLGYYQVGGATGFRDQLQDSTAFYHPAPEIVRNQILLSARHQYEEGDVMHWWHNPKFGLRSRITDDKLFLPLFTAEYVAYTGDTGILNEQLPYLQSPELRHEEDTRFENPPYSEMRESLFKHCLRAIRSALRYGEHGLLVMGSGDWNDGMDHVGREGKGESVFNSMLCYQTLISFSKLCDDDLRRELERIAAELKYAINSFAFENDRYKRLFSDDGRWLGSANSDCLTLDLLVQSYAVISGVADERQSNIVLNTAKSLVDYDAGVIKLLTPPLDKTHYLGYISAYPSGVRENGGQYTHAAMWYLIALTKIGRQDEAFELFQMINPVEKCRNADKNARYMGEPFVFSGDVYSNADNYGRMGWSWYTGSAAWAYRLIIEHFYGLKRDGSRLVIQPKLPKKLSGSTVTYRYHDSVYVLEYKFGEHDDVKINGSSLDDGAILLEKGKKERVMVEVETK